MPILQFQYPIIFSILDGLLLELQVSDFGFHVCHHVVEKLGVFYAFLVHGCRFAGDAIAGVGVVGVFGDVGLEGCRRGLLARLLGVLGGLLGGCFGVGLWGFWETPQKLQILISFLYLLFVI